MRRACSLLAAILLLCLCITPSANAFDFRFSDFYGVADRSSVIVQYAPNGAVRSSLAVQLPQYSYGFNGLAFGPDRLLYAVVAQHSGFSVLALDSSGAVQRTYTHSDYIAGDVADGKICFDNAGRFYVGTGSGLVRFDRNGSSTGTRIYSEQGSVQDVMLLRNGNLMVAAGLWLLEITPNGQYVRQFSISDPNNLLPPNALTLRDCNAFDYDPRTNSMFTYALGDSAFPQRLCKFDASTGALLAYRSWPGVNDMVVANDGRLIVANWHLYNTRIYSSNLVILGTFGGSPTAFITQCVPEPSSMTILACGLGALLLRRRRR